MHFETHLGQALNKWCLMWFFHRNIVFDRNWMVSELDKSHSRNRAVWDGHQSASNPGLVRNQLNVCRCLVDSKYRHRSNIFCDIPKLFPQNVCHNRKCDAGNCWVQMVQVGQRIHQLEFLIFFWIFEKFITYGTLYSHLKFRHCKPFLPPRSYQCDYNRC